MTQDRGRSTLGWLFGNVWTGILAPSIVAVVSGVVLYHFGMSGGKDEARPPEKTAPVIGSPALAAPGDTAPASTIEPGVPRKRPPAAIESKSTAASELDDFAK